MARMLLSLLLLTTQLLAGVCGSLHLCIGDDGSFCGIDAGPKSCHCGHRDDQPSSESGCHPQLSDVLAKPCCEHHDGPHPQNESTDLAVCISIPADSCACTHIPLVLSSEKSTTVLRSPLNESLERSSLLAAWLPVLLLDDDRSPGGSIRQRLEPAERPDFSLTVISTVVIRC